MSSSTPTPALSIRGLSKTFGAHRALRDLDLDLLPGAVHAVVGHNGSGKSTLVKVLAGYHRPDEGSRAETDGEPFELGSAAAAEGAGLRFVHQDLGLVETLDVVDNLFLGLPYPRRAGGRIDWPAARRQAVQALADLGFDLDPRTPVRALSPTQRTAVAIARALHEGRGPTRVLVLDEPTAALPAPEVKVLFDLIGRLREAGNAVLYISHHLEEIFEVSDIVTVVRDGAEVITCPTAELDEERLVELMVGEATATAERVGREPGSTGDVVVRLRGFRSGALRELDVEVRQGEILGVAGIDGSGREELASALFGGLPRTGSVSVSGTELPALRPDLAVRRGIGLVPADRAGAAAFGGMSVGENLTVTEVPLRSPGLRIDRAREREEARDWIERLDVRPPRVEAPIETLSGGNQQKVMVARWLRTSPRLLILDEPTKGVDVAAVGAIWKMLGQAASEGTAMIVCSSDSGELAANCDRVLVLRAGRIVAEVQGTEVGGEQLDALTLHGGGEGA